MHLNAQWILLALFFKTEIYHPSEVKIGPR